MSVPKIILSVVTHGHAMMVPSALTTSTVDQNKSAQQSLPKWMKKSV